jgi:hypothetical protein
VTLYREAAGGETSLVELDHLVSRDAFPNAAGLNPDPLGLGELEIHRALKASHLGQGEAGHDRGPLHDLGGAHAAPPAAVARG